MHSLAGALHFIIDTKLLAAGRHCVDITIKFWVIKITKTVKVWFIVIIRSEYYQMPSPHNINVRCRLRTTVY